MPIMKSKPMAGRHRQRSGSSLMEVTVGLGIFCILGLFFLDAGTLLVAQSINNDCAALAARVAANQITLASGSAAVKALKFAPSPIIQKITQTVAAGPNTPSGKTVTVNSTAQVNLLVPVPLVKTNQIILSTSVTAPALLY